MKAAGSGRNAANGGRSATGPQATPLVQGAVGGFGVKEFIQGLAVGLLLGFLLCLIILH